MNFLQVGGEEISPTEIRKDKGWLDARAKCKKRQMPIGNADPAAQAAATLVKEETYIRRPARTVRRLRIASKKPNRPADNVKIIVRPKDGFSTATHRVARIGDSIRNAAGLCQQETRGDIFRVNETQNVIVVSTPSEERARRYCEISKLRMGDKEYDASAYEAAPENTTKGIIRGILDEDTPEDIERHFVNEHNPTLSQAKGMGKTANAIVVFEGNVVPHYIYYNGTENRCVLYKKQYETCYPCGILGHRSDVCPNPQSKRCRCCYCDDQPVNHQPPMHPEMSTLRQSPPDWIQKIPSQVHDSLCSQGIPVGKQTTRRRRNSQAPKTLQGKRRRLSSAGGTETRTIQLAPCRKRRHQRITQTLTCELGKSRHRGARVGGDCHS
ncbi:hypothetical protein HPB49_014505 [Dermacentor silvarum]|uniref:Uncharacterized protein n=1 Tax=Dermacentor silvarum TaxID=543639 RepID=A0ACB8CLK1_DERSI|nr:hypothetical protein HPB49_014505 [Dermacentor silvarum]